MQRQSTKEEVIKGKSFDVSDVFSGIVEETQKETAAGLIWKKRL